MTRHSKFSCGAPSEPWRLLHRKPCPQMLEGNTILWSITTVNNFRHDVSCLKYLLRPKNVHALCSAPVVGRYHDIYNSARPITEAEANNLGSWFILYSCCNKTVGSIYFTYIGSTIDRLMAYYRQHFLAASILPKMHFLDHTVSFIKQWGTGFGFIGEQGGESVHTEFNSLERVYNNIPNRVDRLYHMV